MFSVLNNTFTKGHENAKSDYIELALQLQFNRRSRFAQPRYMKSDELLSTVVAHFYYGTMVIT